MTPLLLHLRPPLLQLLLQRPHLHLHLHLKTVTVLTLPSSQTLATNPA